MRHRLVSGAVCPVRAGVLASESGETGRCCALGGLVQVMTEQRSAMYEARDEVLYKDPSGLEALALEYADRTCQEIVEG